MSRLNVLHVIPAVAPRYGGPSQVIFEMCRALRKQGTDVLIATTDADWPGRLAVEPGRTVDFQGVQTVFFARQWSERFGYSRPLARWLDRQVASFDAVHIHAVFSHPCLAAARACRRQRVPYIVRPLGSLDPWSLRQRMLLKKVMWHTGVNRLLRSAAALHYTTDEERQLAESSLGLDNGVVIPLGIEMGELEEQGSNGSFRQYHAMLGDRPYVLTLSRLHPKKNVELMLEVFLSLAQHREYDGWRLVIAGDGEPGYVDSLRRLVRQQGGESKVLFAGWLDGAEKKSALQNAALLALPSHQENFGIAAAEALACGVPVVVSEHVNLASEIAQCGAGRVTALDAGQLTSTLLEALRDEGERQRRGRAGRNLVARRFSWEILATELIHLYAFHARKAARLEAQYSVS